MLREEEYRHAVKAKRYKIGEVIDVVDGVGGFYQVEIQRIRKNGIQGRVLSREGERGELGFYVCLAQGMIKGNRFDLVVEKCTEIGIDRILPVESERSVLLHPSEGRVARWRRIAHAAMKQSGRSRLPSIDVPRPLREVLLEMTQNLDLVLMAWEGENGRKLKDIIEEREPIRSAGAIVGPEGGFGEIEVQLAQEMGVELFSLGPSKLRSETAGVVAVALLVYELDRNSVDRQRRT